VDERVREAIAVANNEIHRAAASRPEWKGMACVLTVAVIKDGVATVGHVGDTRLYKIRQGRIEKVTRDHSPVGEREDAGELSESERDAASAAERGVPRRGVRAAPAGRRRLRGHRHRAGRTRCRAAALQRRLERPRAGGHHQRRRDAVRRRSAARSCAGSSRPPIDAGGKDNVTAVFVEGERACGLRWRRARGRRAARIAGRAGRSWCCCSRSWGMRSCAPASCGGRRIGHAAVAVVPGVLVVEPGGSIPRRSSRPARRQVIVEPGEYRERCCSRTASGS
jgi:hypothetical protein